MYSQLLIARQNTQPTPRETLTSFMDDKPTLHQDKSAPEDSDDLIGSVLAKKYRIVERLGRGAMGTVYKAEHSYMSRIVAIKVLHKHLVNKEESFRRFSQEARTASKLSHPHAVTLYDFGIDEGRPYLVMKYCKGETLKSLLLRDKPLSLERTRSYLKQICSALQLAHSLGIIHRDLKPDNIMVTQRKDGTEWLEILDFGIAKVARRDEEASSSIVTQTGVVIGTPLYMSPEQALGKELDARADLYSVAVIAYEMLSGKVPFRSQSMMELLMQQINDPAESMRKASPELDLSKSVDRVVLQALEKDPEKRFSSIEEFYETFSSASQIGPRAPLFESQKSLKLLVAAVLFVLTPVLGYTAIQYSGSTTTELATVSFGQLYVESDPPGARVVLNGMEQQRRTPLLVTDLDPGSYSVRASLDGYASALHTLDISAGQKYSMEFPLEVQSPSPEQAKEEALQLEQERQEQLAIEAARLKEIEDKAAEEQKRLAKEQADTRRQELERELKLAAQAAEKQNLEAKLLAAKAEAKERELAAKKAEAEAKESQLAKQRLLEEKKKRQKQEQATSKVRVAKKLLKSPPPSQIVKSTAITQNTITEARKLFADGKYESAIASLQRYVKNKRGSAEAHDLLGRSYLASRKSATFALKEFQTAFRLRPNDPKIRFHRAQAYAKLGRRANALRDLEEAVKKNAKLAAQAKSNPAFKYYRKLPRFIEIVSGN